MSENEQLPLSLPQALTWTRPKGKHTCGRRAGQLPSLVGRLPEGREARLLSAACAQAAGSAWTCRRCCRRRAGFEVVEVS